MPNALVTAATLPAQRSATLRIRGSASNSRSSASSSHRRSYAVTLTVPTMRGGPLIRRPPLANERVEGVRGNREVPPDETEEGGNVGETSFPECDRMCGGGPLTRDGRGGEGGSLVVGELEAAVDAAALAAVGPAGMLSLAVAGDDDGALPGAARRLGEERLGREGLVHLVAAPRARAG